MHGLDKAARAGEPEDSTRANMIALLRATELIEHAVELIRWNAATFIHDLQRDRAALTHTSDRYRGVTRCIFCGVIQQIEQHLFEQDGVELQHRQVGRQLQRYLVMPENLAG